VKLDKVTTIRCDNVWFEDDQSGRRSLWQRTESDLENGLSVRWRLLGGAISCGDADLEAAYQAWKAEK
jgi:hypothetical protein